MRGALPDAPEETIGEDGDQFVESGTCRARGVQVHANVSQAGDEVKRIAVGEVMREQHPIREHQGQAHARKEIMQSLRGIFRLGQVIGKSGAPDEDDRDDNQKVEPDPRSAEQQSGEDEKEGDILKGKARMGHRGHKRRREADAFRRQHLCLRHVSVVHFSGTFGRPQARRPRLIRFMLCSPRAMAQAAVPDGPAFDLFACAQAVYRLTETISAGPDC